MICWECNRADLYPVYSMRFATDVIAPFVAPRQHERVSQCIVFTYLASSRNQTQSARLARRSTAPSEHSGKRTTFPFRDESASYPRRLIRMRCGESLLR